MRLSRSLTLAVSGAVLVLVTGYAATRGGAGNAPAAHHALHAGTGVDVPAPAQVGTPIRIAVAPDGAAAPGVYRFHKNDSVEFHVSAPYGGMLAIHGYTGDVAIAAHRELTLPLKLAYTGRFPMHIHVSDGRHIEVAVLEILPD